MKSLLISILVAGAVAVPAAASDWETFPLIQLDPSVKLLALYTAAESRYRLTGLASYYSDSLDGTLTANGERYHKRKLTAAHLKLPLGTIVEVTAKATGKTIRLRVNDRGPYVKKFCLDLSHAAARVLGVDRAEDRTVTIRIISLPGLPPLPEDLASEVAAEEVSAER